jgi:hypothetical protein
MLQIWIMSKDTVEQLSLRHSYVIHFNSLSVNWGKPNLIVRMAALYPNKSQSTIE